MIPLSLGPLFFNICGCFSLGPVVFFNRIKPLWGQHPSRSPLLISSRGTDVRTAVSNGCASQEWSCGFNPYVKYVTLDIIGYKIYIYIYTYIYLYTLVFLLSPFTKWGSACRCRELPQVPQSLSG